MACSKTFQKFTPGRLFVFLFWAGISTSRLIAGTIYLDATPLAPNTFRYEYTFRNFNLLMNQEIDIRFDPAYYVSLSNGIASSDFALLLLQPDNPPGTFGDYSARALMDHPSMQGPFSVDVRLRGFDPPPQPFFIHQFDPSGTNVILTIGSGTVTTPEPGNWTLGVFGIFGVFFLRTCSRYRA
jgi:hypothetical protein